MTIAIPVYCTREDVAQALDVKMTARNFAQIDRAVQAGTLSVEGQLNRQFWVWAGTRRFDWPTLPFGGAYPWRVWLDANEVISVTSVVSGGITIPPSGYLLEPTNYGPPYSHIDINLGTNNAFSSGSTWQQSLLLTGQFSGAPATTTPGGALAAAISTVGATTCDVTDSSAIGVGSTLVIDTERLLVTGRQMLTSGQTLQAPGLTASDANVTVPVTDGTAFFVGEVLLIDSERMLVVDIAGNNLTVRRSWDGSVLALHNTGVTIYASRRLAVVRGFAGTTAATHSNSAAIAVATYPALVSSLNIAEAINILLSDEAGWARSIGSGDAIRNASGAGLKDLRDRAYSEHARKVRMRSV